MNSILTKRMRSLRAFTLAELTVVLGAIVLLLAVAVPAFSALIESQKRSLAETQLRVAIASARALALEQPAGIDTAAVFTFEPGGQLIVVSCVQVGTLTDNYIGTDAFPRDVFVPAATVQPSSLPGGWVVRGLATTDMLGGDWYSNNNSGSSSTVPNSVGAGINWWVFPETGFYDLSDPLAGENRQTFMIRFDGGTGALSNNDTEALILLRRPANPEDRNPGSFERRLYDAEDPARFVRTLLSNPAFTTDPQAVREVLGDVSSDTVLARAVRSVALYRERDLAAALDLTPDRRSGVLYASDPSASPNDPFYPNGPQPVTGFDPEEAFLWITSGQIDTATAGFADRVGSAPSRIFGVGRYDGRLIDLAQALEEAP
jgi:type II secretory pathway pseudopilin PulG